MKINDRVRIKDTVEFESDGDGTNIGTVRVVDENRRLNLGIQLDGGDVQVWFFAEEELELVEPADNQVETQ
jgi:hypothetical protein